MLETSGLCAHRCARACGVPGTGLAIWFCAQRCMGRSPGAVQCRGLSGTSCETHPLCSQVRRLAGPAPHRRTQPRFEQCQAAFTTPPERSASGAHTQEAKRSPPRQPEMSNRHTSGARRRIGALVGTLFLLCSQVRALRGLRRGGLGRRKGWPAHAAHGPRKRSAHNEWPTNLFFLYHPACNTELGGPGNRPTSHWRGAGGRGGLRAGHACTWAHVPAQQAAFLHLHHAASSADSS